MTYRKLNRLVYVIPALAILAAWGWWTGPAFWEIVLGWVAIFQVIAAAADACTSLSIKDGELHFARWFQHVSLRPDDINLVQFKAIMLVGGTRPIPKISTFRISNARSFEILLSRYGWLHGKSMFRELNQWLAQVDEERISPEASQQLRSAAGISTAPARDDTSR